VALQPANPGKNRRSATFRRFAALPGCHFGAPNPGKYRADAILFGMADKDKASGMKSAYELALERMEKQGIERPREESFGDELREKIADLRRKAEAKIAELEILHKSSMRTVYDPAKRQEDEEAYLRERHRIEDDRDRKVEELRKG
jgi:hypothetical protein